MRSLIVAFSMYSRIPMPHVDWDEKAMRYVMCFFPLVGAVIGALEYAAYRLLMWGGAAEVLTASILTVIPIFFTGGIHLDGFMDTVDALSSYRSREERLEILKDPNIGAFAVIYAAAYFVLYFGFMTELLGTKSDRSFAIFCASFVITPIAADMDAPMQMVESIAESGGTAPRV